MAKILTNGTSLNPDEFHIAVFDDSETKWDLFRLRYEVMVDTHGYLEPNESKILVDDYDFTNQAIQIGCFNHMRELIGAVRIVLDSKDGIPSDQFFDYDQLNEAYSLGCKRDEGIADVNKIIVRKEYKGLNLGIYLMHECHRVVRKTGSVAAIGSANPIASSLFEKVGYRLVGKVQTFQKDSRSFVPIFGLAKDLK